MEKAELRYRRQVSEDETPKVYFEVASEPDTEESKYIRHIKGSIRIVREGGEVEVGSMELTWIQVDNIRFLADEDPGWTCYCDSSEICSAYSSIYSGDGELRPELEERYPPSMKRDLLLIDEVKITEKNYQRSGLGECAIWEAVEMFGGSCSFVMLIPFPLQWTDYLDRSDLVSCRSEIESDFNKLRAYYADLGFRPLPGFEGDNSEPFWVYSLELVRQPKVRIPRWKLRAKSSSSSPLVIAHSSTTRN